MSTARTEDGVTIDYEVYGSGPLAVLFLHGWGNAASFWNHILTEHMDLSGLRCIAASYRGHGGSGAADTGYTHETFARDVLAVADHAGAREFAVVAFSMAGKFCRYLPYVASRRILGQVLITPPGPEALPVPREAFAPWIEAAPHPQQFRAILAQFTKQPVREDLIDLYCNNVARASRAALEGTIDMFYEDISDQVQGAKLPTLILGGTFDPIFTPGYLGDVVRRAIPGARLLTLPCGHEIPVEMPQETSWIVESFLAGLQIH